MILPSFRNLLFEFWV
ncbi:hypothetical protein LINGRAHAP2_LOCUS17945 [Linum grandiflorum]